MTTTKTIDRPPAGLRGVSVADTALGDVVGDRGTFHYRGYDATDLARRRTFEDTWALLLDGSLPDAAGRAGLVAELAPLRTLSNEVAELVGPIARASATVGEALRTALSLHAASLGQATLVDADRSGRRRAALAVAAAVPALIGAIHRARAGLDPIAPDPGRSIAADHLHMVGLSPTPAEERALEQYLILTVDHGFNASTFTARTIASTGTDVGSALVGALGALLGPRHGGAPSRALDTLDEIGDPAGAGVWVRERLARGERIMGFGHPVYRTEDPRSAMLRDLALGLGGDRVHQAVAVEAEVLAALAEHKPDQVLRTNVEWYAAVLMERVGLPRELFTPTFCLSRVVGWTAHVLEQSEDPRIVRPSATYVGPPVPRPVPDV